MATTERVQLDDLQDRLAKAAAELHLLASQATTVWEEKRLRGKAEGVALALTYIEELA